MHTRSVLLARVRLRFPRGAVAYWTAVALLVLVTAAVISGVLRRAQASQAELGPSIGVLVATSDLPAGAPLEGRVTLRPRPAKLVPKGALTAVPAGRVATAFIAADEPVLAARVSGNDAAGPAGLIPPGARALTVPVGSVAPPVRVGDHVDVLATPVPGGDDRPASASTARVVVHAAVVVATGADGVTVAVPADHAPALAEAIARSTVALAVTGPER